MFVFTVGFVVDLFAGGEEIIEHTVDCEIKMRHGGFRFEAVYSFGVYEKWDLG